MDTGKTTRIAVVGIDGAGKSTLIRRFIELAALEPTEVVSMTCPGYHDTPNAPLASLSRALDVFSRSSDGLGSFPLKAASLFMQMTLFGPVERFLVETFGPRVLLCERHAVVDTLAYGPFYGALVTERPDRDALEEPLRERIAAQVPGGYEAILAWHALECRRLGLDLDFWDIAPHVAELCRRPPSELVPELERRYRASLPDVVLLLDIPAEVATQRVSERAEAELHEQTAMLEKLRQSYFAVLQRLGQLQPSIRTHRIDGASEGGIDDTLREVSAIIEASG